jgi:hypothetical protein
MEKCSYCSLPFHSAEESRKHFCCTRFFLHQKNSSNIIAFQSWLDNFIQDNNQKITQLQNTVVELKQKTEKLDKKIDEHNAEYKRWKAIHSKNSHLMLLSLLNVGNKPQLDWIEWHKEIFSIDRSSLENIFMGNNLFDIFLNETKRFYSPIKRQTEIPIRVFPEKKNNIYVFIDEKWQKMDKIQIQQIIDYYSFRIGEQWIYWRKNTPKNENYTNIYNKYISFKWTPLSDDKKKLKIIKMLYETLNTE